MGAEYQVVQIPEFIIGSHWEKDALRYGGLRKHYPGLLIGKRTSDKAGMITRIGTVSTLTSKVIELSELNQAEFFSVGEVLTLRHKLIQELADVSRSKAITGASKAAAGVITCTAHGFATGDKVRISGVEGMVELNGQVATITVLTVNTFSIPVSTTAYTTYTSGGVVEPIVNKESFVDIALGNVVEIDDENNAVEYSGTPTVDPVAGDYILVKDGSENPVGILHSFVNPDDSTLDKSMRFVWHGRVDKNRIRNWHESVSSCIGLSQILFVEREVE